MKAQREHLENGGLHNFGRGTTGLAFPQAIDSGPLFEVGDLSLQVAVDFEKKVQAEKTELRRIPSVWFIRFIVHTRGG